MAIFAVSPHRFVEYPGHILNLEKGRLVMEKPDGITDVGEMKDRMMIELFKKKLQEAKADLPQLRGSWNEAGEILKAHFGKITRTMVSNENKLRNLYQAAIDELKKEAT
jgi:hypothetical protein